MSRRTIITIAAGTLLSIALMGCGPGSGGGAAEPSGPGGTAGAQGPPTTAQPAPSTAAPGEQRPAPPEPTRPAEGGQTPPAGAGTDPLADVSWENQPTDLDCSVPGLGIEILDFLEMAPLLEQALGIEFAQIWGDPVAQRRNWEAHDPCHLAKRLRHTAVFLACGDGTPGALDPPGTEFDPAEAINNELNRTLAARLTRAGVPLTTEFT